MAQIGWKIAYDAWGRGEVLVKLSIPDNARVCKTIFGYSRCDRAKVLEMTSRDGLHTTLQAVSLKDIGTVYVVGENVYSNNRISISDRDFNANPRHRHGPGIYYFETKEQALNYEFGDYKYNSKP